MSHPTENKLLRTLPEEVKGRLFPQLTLVELPLGKVIFDAGQKVSKVYFPSNSIISLSSVMSDGSLANISVVGNDGLAGIAVFMGGESTPNCAIVQTAGFAYSLPAAKLRQEFNNNQLVRLLLLRYTQALIAQMAQTALCNRHHPIKESLCRWLLLSLDRLRTNHLNITQELIANMLGVRRESVTEAAGKLQKLGVIEYKRGYLTVINRNKLEDICCECYSTVQCETERLDSHLF